MRVGKISLLQAYAATSIVILGLTAASADVSSQSDGRPGWVVSDVAGNTEGQTLESSGDFQAYSPQQSGPSGNGKEHCEIGCGEDGKATTVNGIVDSLDGPYRAGFTAKVQTQERVAVSSQQAVELLVSSWNDLSKWAPLSDTSSVCKRDVEKSVHGFLSNEMWALRIFDSWAKPGPSLLDGRSDFTGNYYQCREAVDKVVAKETGFKGNYCDVTLHNLSSLNFHFPSFLLKLRSSMIHLGTCLPDTCSQDEITQIFEERLHALNLTKYLAAGPIDCRTDDWEYNKFTGIALFIVVVFGTLVSLGTVVDVAIVLFPFLAMPPQPEKNAKYKRGNSPEVAKKSPEVVKESPEVVKESPEVVKESPGVTKESKASQHKTTPSVWVKVLLSFSLHGNGRRFLSTSQPAGSINVIPGLRFINMSWIVVGHTYFLLIYTHGSNVTDGISRLSSYPVFDLISMMPFGVDSFFTISGILVSYLTIQKVLEKGWGFEWKRFFLHRYWRLTPTLMVSLVLTQGLQPLVVSGSVAPTLQPSDILACEERWWYLPLYINNLVNQTMEQHCFPHTWSLAADFQFYLLSPLMMVPFYYNKLAGTLSCVSFIVGQWIIAGVASYYTEGAIGMLRVTTEWFQYYYIPFYSRVAPFTIGILAGYILRASNGQVRMSPVTVAIGWVTATAAGLIIIFGFHGDLINDSSLFVASIFNAVSRSIWGAVICWVVIACSSGYGGPVTAFLSWSPFVVLSRVTYIGYLIQITVSTIIFQNLEQMVYMNFTSLIVYGVVDVAFTCLVSAVLVVCVEFPLLNMERVLRDQK